jgi:CRP-like cAMP-binding protein
LSKIEHLKDLSLDKVVEIVRSGQIQYYKRGEVIFIKNDPGKGLYVLLSGQVQLCKFSPEGQIAILAMFDPVIMFNEVAALDRGPTPATALAKVLRPDRLLRTAQLGLWQQEMPRQPNRADITPRE